MTVNTNNGGGYPVGNRTNEPHHPDGWFSERPADSESTGPMPRRGQPPASGEHDRPKK